MQLTVEFPEAQTLHDAWDQQDRLSQSLRCQHFGTGTSWKPETRTCDVFLENQDRWIVKDQEAQRRQIEALITKRGGRIVV